MLQHLCAKVPDKADYRAYAGTLHLAAAHLVSNLHRITDEHADLFAPSCRAGEALVHIFGLLPNKERPRFVTFLTKYLPPSALDR